MIILISETQLNSIIRREFFELSTKEKEPLGFGAWHKVYNANYKPDVVYKVGYEDVVDNWYELFKEHPDIFPKVYKKGTVIVPIKDKSGNVVDKIRKSYVELEKLDTSRLEKEWKQIDKYCTEKPFQYYITRIEDNDEFFEELSEKISKVNTPLYEALARIYNLVYKIFEIKPAADIHMGQFGYDKQGNLKCLDL
jgi:hypothetical protein